LSLSAGAAVLIALSVLLWDAATLPLCTGFLILMASQAFIFGNSAALAVTNVTDRAGSASALLGIVQALALALSAPLASSGGTTTAVPMVIVIVIGVLGATGSHIAAQRPSITRTGALPAEHQPPTAAESEPGGRGSPRGSITEPGGEDAN
jgi:DHA1 family bicyclomycin/chloramphenicol resistance-like MFS transporter